MKTIKRNIFLDEVLNLFVLGDDKYVKVVSENKKHTVCLPKNMIVTKYGGARVLNIDVHSKKKGFECYRTPIVFIVENIWLERK